MDNYFSLKYIISFFIGIIVYKLIQNKCSCDIIEGQSADDKKIMNHINRIIKNRNKEHIKNLIVKFAIITKTVDVDENTLINDVLDNVNSFSDLGDPFNAEALEIVDLIIQNFIKMDTDEIQTGIESHLLKDNENMCEMDINLYLMMFAYLLYSNSDKISSENYTNVLNISNKLSRYLPEILEKVQELYENCPDDDNSTYDKHKAEILNRIYHKLFKSNETIINFNGFGKLIKSLENVKTIYIALFMICITFIIVKFIGIFNLGPQ
jgi:hypothetical protein